MKKQIKEDQFRKLMKEAGLEEPSAEFSRHLTNQVITYHAYQRPDAAGYKQEWVGKAIILVLVALNGLMLIKLDPFRVQPVLCWAAGGFIVAFSCVIAWIKKYVALPPA